MAGTRRAIVRSAGLLALLLACAGTGLGAERVYDGMTERELADFAERQGWRTEVSQRSVVIHAGEARIDVNLLECGEKGPCKSGILRDTSYYFIKEPRAACSFWHWNLETRGATGFGPDYVTLQRYVQFRGVTDRYLRDVMDAWLGAAPSFWALVKTCYEAGAEQGPKPAP